MWLEILAAVLAVIFVIYQFIIKDEKKSSSLKIPGLEPSDPIEGNRKDIENAGTLSAFLNDLHKKYGPIARFYEGKDMTITIASPDLMKQTRNLFHIRPEFFHHVKMFAGEEVFQFCNSNEIKRRRKVYDQHFMMSACKTYSDTFVHISKTLVEKWMKSNGASIPLTHSMARYSMTSLLKCCFGDVFNDEKTLDEFKDLADWVIKRFDPKPIEGSDVYKKAVEYSNKMKAMMQKIIDQRAQEKCNDEEPEWFLDVVMNMDISENARKADLLLFIVAGYFTVSYMLSWILYELALHPDMQEKIYQEIVLNLGDKSVTVETMPTLTYLRQVIDETLRIYTSPSFIERVAETDMEIGGYSIPAGTAIYQTFGPVVNDPQLWKNPEKFDPDRFSRENSRGRNPYAFKPFGFAGKRVCPGMNFGLSEMTIFISECLRHCRVHLVPGQEVVKVPVFFLVPAQEIMIMIENR